MLFDFTSLFVRWSENESPGSVGANGPIAPATDDRKITTFITVRLNRLPKYD